MRKRLLLAGCLLLMAPLAVGMDFQPGYWAIKVSGATGEHVAKRCLKQVKPQFSPRQEKFCKRLKYGVSGNTMSSRVHCAFPHGELVSFEQLTFSGTTMHGTVRIDVLKPEKRIMHYTIEGKRISERCPAPSTQ